MYFRVIESPFLFSMEHLPGSVTMNGKTFDNIKIRYDIYNDELLTPFSSAGILQLNKEMVDSFSILFQNNRYRFIRLPEDSLIGLKGFVNVVYKGKTALYIKYIKKIEYLAVEGKYDKFYQVSRIYLVKDNIVSLINSKSDFFSALTKDKLLLKNFIRINQLIISTKDPGSFVPVLRYFDSVNQ